MAVYFPRWPGDFKELLRCWEIFRDRKDEIIPSYMEKQSERDYYTLFRLNGFENLRIYFGNEFCEHCIPGASAFEKAFTASESAGFSLTLLTPPCGEAKLNRLKKLFALAERLNPETEVVANDWGVLETLKSGYPGLRPVLGRLMNRFLRDPRVTPRYLRPDAPPEALKVIRECSLSIPAFREILKQYGVERVELDYLYQKIGIDFRNIGLKPSLYIPFGYLTTGRICQFGNLYLSHDSKFEIMEKCSKPCKKFEARLFDSQSQNDGGIHSFWQRGNTIFYKLNGPMVSEAIAWSNQQGARLVFQPELPF